MAQTKLFPVTVVGSWSRPSWLVQALRRRQAGEISKEEFDRIADDASHTSQVQPLGGEVVDQRPGTRIRQHPPHLLFEDGRIAEQGPPEQIFGAPQNERTRQFLSAVLEAG